MNWVSGKVNVWTRPGWLVSSVPSSFTSTTCRRGWYLCRDCKTTICPRREKRAPFNVCLFAPAPGLALGRVEPTGGRCTRLTDWLWDSTGDGVAGTHWPRSLGSSLGTGKTKPVCQSSVPLPYSSLEEEQRFFTTYEYQIECVYFPIQFNQYLCSERWIPEWGRVEGKDNNLMN